MSSGTNKLSTRRRSREEIIELFRACAAKLNRTPGAAEFERTCGISVTDIRRHFWKSGYTELAEAAGLPPNTLRQRLEDDQVFEDYAKICLHIGRIPSGVQLQGATRELGTKTWSVKSRFAGGTAEFQERFRQWLATQPLELQKVANFDGWHTPRTPNGVGGNLLVMRAEPWCHPFLPASLQYLNVLARGDRPPFDPSDQSVPTIFERRTADAFRCLGFEISQLGQGTGRNADTLALAPRERFAVIIDAKVRSAGYVLGTEDRKFLEYARSHGAELQRQGYENLYFVVVGSAFKEGDLRKLTDALSSSPIRSTNLLTASALMRLVEDSIRDRSKFSLGDFERQLFAHKVIAT